MISAAVGIALSGLGRSAVKGAVVLILTVLVALAFAVASAAVVVELLAAAVLSPSLVAPSATPVGAGPSVGKGAEVVALARAQIGTPYVWGGAGPGGFDCSGLVQWAYAQVGVSLPRTAQGQFDATARIGTTDIQPGDLLFYAGTYDDAGSVITHVGIYIGDGQMINAPTDGDVVRMMPAFSGYWGAHYAGAGRVGG